MVVVVAAAETVHYHAKRVVWMEVLLVVLTHAPGVVVVLDALEPTSVVVAAAAESGTPENLCAVLACHVLVAVVSVLA